MQKEATVLINRPETIKVYSEWDLDSAKEFTNILFEYVSDGRIIFELNAKKGSIVSEFLITIFEGLSSAILYDLIKLIFRILKREKKLKREVKPTHIFTLEKEYIVTGDNKSTIPEDLKKELFD